MSAYLNVFLESAWVASVIPFSSEPTFFAMKAFGNFDMRLAWLMAVTGATAGHIFNWYVGRILYRMPVKKEAQINPALFDKFKKLFQKYGVFLLLFAWAPLFNILVVLSGLLGIRLKVVLPLVALGVAVHYGLALL